LKGEWPRLDLGRSGNYRSYQVTQRKGIGRCSSSGAEGDGGWRGLPGSCGGMGVTGRGGGVEVEGRRAGGAASDVDDSAVDERGGDWRGLLGEGFRGSERAWERLVD